MRDERELNRRALANVPLTKETVQSFWDGTRSGTPEQCLLALCISHERLRMELAGAEKLLAEGRWADQDRLDWLESKTVEVRTPLVHGSRPLFFAEEISDEGEEYRTNLREMIDDQIMLETPIRASGTGKGPS